MIHIGTRQIETERLILRRFNMEDVADAFHGWFSDPDAAMYMRWDAHTDLSQTYEIIVRCFFQKALEIMEVGTPVILDWGFWNRADRKETTDYFAQHGYDVEWHGISISDEDLRSNVQSRFEEMVAGRGDVYPADENLLAKATDIIEPPAEDEMDIWVRVK